MNNLFVFNSDHRQRRGNAAGGYLAATISLLIYSDTIGFLCLFFQKSIGIRVTQAVVSGKSIQHVDFAVPAFSHANYLLLVVHTLCYSLCLFVPKGCCTPRLTSHPNYKPRQV